MPNPATFSLAVMAHPSRSQWVGELAISLGIALDVHWDRYGDRWDTGRRALLAFDPHCDYHLVIQDDVLVAKDLIAALPRAISFVPPGSPISLYAGNSKAFRQSLPLMDRKTTSWLILPTLVWGPALVLPTADIPAVVAHGDALPALNYDTRIGTFYDDRHIPCWYPFPSWVEHRDEGSLIGHRPGRKALAYLGTNASCLTANLSRHTAPVPYAPR